MEDDPRSAEPSGPAPGPDAGFALPANRDDNLWAMLAHLSLFFAPLLGPVLVLVLRKDQSAFVADHAREALNLHATLAIEAMVAVVFSVVTLGIGTIVAAPLAAVVGTVYTLLSLLATIRANEGQGYRYPAILRLF